MHASHTNLGHKLDARVISVYSFLLHQASMDAFGITNPLLRDLSESDEEQTSAIDVSKQLTKLFVEGDTNSWGAYLTSDDFPNNFNRSFACIVTTFSILMLPTWFSEWFVPELLTAILGGDEFIVDKYFPEMVKELQDKSLGILEWLNAARFFVGLIIKLLIAFMYQEEAALSKAIDRGVYTVWFQGITLWLVNITANIISDQYQTDSAVTWALGVYPGDSFCRTT